MCGTKPCVACEFDLDTYGGKGGRLTGMMRRYMLQQSQQQGVSFGSPPNGAPDFNPKTSFSPLGVLLGRLLSLHAEQNQYQPFAEKNEQMLSVSPDLNFRQLVRIPNTTQLQGTIRSSNPPGNPASQSSVAFDSNTAARPERSFSDRLQAAWDHPHP